MSRSIPFRKYHGNGNDFIVLDGLSRSLPVDLLERPDVAVQICHRHTGVGADGLLLMLPPNSPNAHARMRVINADGSEAEMCGNGIRCVAKALHDHHETLGREESLLVDTGAGPLSCGLTLDPDSGLVRSVRVAMGAPVLERPEIPMEGEGRFVDSALNIDGRELMASAVSMGNPHLVSFVDPASGQTPRQLAETLGPRLEHHPLFPNRTNVEFALPEDGGLELWVWERGCGITQACGTGACATAVAAQVTGRFPPGEPLIVRLPGGPLTIEVAEDLSQVWMDGPAEEVFTGEIDLRGV